MRVFELFEYDDIGSEKENIIQTISGLDATDEKHAAILDRIFKLLNSEHVGGRISTAFAIPLGDEKFNQTTKQAHIVAITKIISNLDANYKSIGKFLDQIEKGDAVNIKELSKPVNSLTTVFNNDPVALKCFDALKMYGVGQLQKGPGEFALAFMSDKIRLAIGTGDLEIKGIGKVELKTATGDGGGRLGGGGIAQTVQHNILQKFQESIPAIYERITSSRGGSIGLIPFVTMLNQELPLNVGGNRKIRQDIALALLKPNFGSFASQMAAAFTKEDPKQVLEEYVKGNFEWYKNNDSFDGFLIIGIARGKTMMIRTGNELVKLYNAGHLRLTVTIIGTRSGASREVFTQISPTATGI